LLRTGWASVTPRSLRNTRSTPAHAAAPMDSSARPPSSSYPSSRHLDAVTGRRPGNSSGNDPPGSRRTRPLLREEGRAPARRDSGGVACSAGMASAAVQRTANVPSPAGLSDDRLAILVPADLHAPVDQSPAGCRDGAVWPIQGTRVSALEGALLDDPGAADELVLSGHLGVRETVEPRLVVTGHRIPALKPYAT
jgi:hypothetical protein